MTLALAQRRRVPKRLRTPADDLSAGLFELVATSSSPEWPSPRYRSDPVGFQREVLGIEPWSKQVEILESVRDHPLTSVKSGHRIGKSVIAAGTGLWFYSSFDDARVICTAPTARQVEDILWREVRKLHERAGRCVECKRADPTGIRIPRPCPHSGLLDGKLSTKPATGLVSANFREIRGYTAKDVEAITGTAGANLLFILDEASGIADAIYEGLEGNRAGWSEEAGIMVRMLLIGNPTKTSGEFYDSHEHPKKKKLYNRLTVSSRETPNVTAGRVVVPGLATAEWIAQMEAKYGPDSVFVKVRIDGVFPIGEDGKAFSIALITESEQRWEDEEGEGPLYIGLDPAGESGEGDDTAMSARRGKKQIALRRWTTGLTEAEVGVHLIDMISAHRVHRRERAIVVMDSEGAVGAKVYAHLAVLAAKPGAAFELHRVRASERAWREPITFDRVRDELAHNLHQWMRDGGAIISDEFLEQELHVLEWGRMGSKLKITPKKEVRKQLGRSPDSYDATALSTWEPLAASAGSQHGGYREPEEDDDVDDRIDPYRGRGRIDPYGGRGRR